MMTRWQPDTAQSWVRRDGRSDVVTSSIGDISSVVGLVRHASSSPLRHRYYQHHLTCPWPWPWPWFIHVYDAVGHTLTPSLSIAAENYSGPSAIEYHCRWITVILSTSILNCCSHVFLAEFNDHLPRVEQYLFIFAHGPLRNPSPPSPIHAPVSTLIRALIAKSTESPASQNAL